jgi:BASS family bile acid:Na+ symporter
VNAARSSLAWLGRRAPWALAAGVFTGLAVPPLAALLRPAFVPAVVLLLTLSMARVDPARLRRTARAAPLIAAALACALVAAPAVVALLTLPLGLPDGIRTGVVLYAGAPPLVAAAAFALLTASRPGCSPIPAGSRWRSWPPSS